MLALCTMVAILFGMPVSAATNNFTDITNHWGKTYINYVCNTKGVMEGLNGSTTTFAPNTALTRADFVRTLGKVCGIKESEWKSSSKFTDVLPSSKYYPYVNWAASIGITSGTSATTFSPNNSIKRQDLAKMLYTYLTKYSIPVKLGTYPTFKDQSTISAYATAAVKYVAQAGLMKGDENQNFKPQNNITRAETASIIYNLYVKYLSKEQYTARTLNINVGTTNSFYKEHTSTSDIGNYIAYASYPFTNRWNLNFKSTWVNLYHLPEDSCSKWNTVCNSSCCGSRCVDDSSSPNHNKNWYKNFYHVLSNMDYSGKAFRVVATSATYCDNQFGAGHGTHIGGLSLNELSMVRLVKSQRQTNIRLIQHEVTHLFGPDDGKCSPGVLCIMSGGFDNNTTYNLANIWCPACSNNFSRLRY